jgi:hypothetical protein
MLPKDVAGIFSRFFISGFFVPTFSTLFVLWLAVSHVMKPVSFREESSQTQILILGAWAILIGLVLQGMRFRLIRIYEGYPIRDRLLLRPLKWIAIPLQRLSYWRVKRQGHGEAWRETWLLDRRFPDKAELLPTRFGNAFRAFENYPGSRWGLDMIAVWPRIDALLSPRAQELHWNAYTDLMLFLNLSLGGAAAGVVLIVNEAIDPRLAGVVQSSVLAVPFLLAYFMYRFAIGAAERLGTERRVAVDLHRLELYRALGILQPEERLTLDNERARIGPAVSELLNYGTPIEEAGE